MPDDVLSKIEPTNDKLKADAASLCSQYLQFWLPGEVEVTVLLSRPGSKEITYATSITERERLLDTLRRAVANSAIQTAIIRGNRFKR